MSIRVHSWFHFSSHEGRNIRGGVSSYDKRTNAGSFPGAVEIGAGVSFGTIFYNPSTSNSDEPEPKWKSGQLYTDARKEAQ